MLPRKGSGFEEQGFIRVKRATEENASGRAAQNELTNLASPTAIVLAMV